MFISATIVREIAVLGGNVDDFVASVLTSNALKRKRSASRFPMALKITDQCINYECVNRNARMI